MLQPLHSDTTEEQYKKHFCNKSNHYGNTGHKEMVLQFNTLQKELKHKGGQW